MVWRVSIFFLCSLESLNCQTWSSRQLSALTADSRQPQRPTAFPNLFFERFQNWAKPCIMFVSTGSSALMVWFSFRLDYTPAKRGRLWRQHYTDVFVITKLDSFCHARERGKSSETFVSVRRATTVAGVQARMSPVLKCTPGTWVRSRVSGGHGPEKP